MTSHCSEGQGVRVKCVNCQDLPLQSEKPLRPIAEDPGSGLYVLSRRTLVSSV